jgi:curved DNA-binding protein CbpA
MSASGSAARPRAAGASYRGNHHRAGTKCPTRFLAAAVGLHVRLLSVRYTGSLGVERSGRERSCDSVALFERLEPEPSNRIQGMSQEAFRDHYEVLQLSPNATGDTVERVYRLLAKRYHPDNLETGDAEKFSELSRAFEVLSDPAQRAAYDVRYDEHRSTAWKIFKQSDAGDARAEDRRLFHGVLSLLYIARRRNPKDAGLGATTLEKMLGCPQEHLEFPLWYLKQRGWIERTETGFMAITADGVDKLGNDDLSLPANRLLAESNGNDMSASAEADRPPHLLREASDHVSGKTE